MMQRRSRWIRRVAVPLPPQVVTVFAIPMDGMRQWNDSAALCPPPGG